MVGDIAGSKFSNECKFHHIEHAAGMTVRQPMCQTFSVCRRLLITVYQGRCRYMHINQKSMRWSLTMQQARKLWNYLLKRLETSQNKAARLPVEASEGMASGRCHLTSHATLRLIELTLHPMGSELAFMQPACHGLNPCKPAIFRQAAEVGAYSFVLVHRIGGCYCICGMGKKNVAQVDSQGSDARGP
ncbi:hypothetical protein M419DRAFT_38623 [Trichoderma reesei RUT C-30]|uniref:Uncharacterized protein n=1 Tax=Hypocrea jecorina (strain ATCC 56765 / BCRC 32924 / NRRL 11460 / Rut C-30) TaxID=1344414 RepID=A0A024RZ46_HYPJR|nr:hypothetical protein M419DRAFT_38623 [Trichoderma reesei RUT C-30]